MNEIIKGLSKNLLEENPEIEARIKHGIELHRKGTAKFTLLGKDGTEIRNAEIELKQTKHQFEFGCNGFMINQFREAEKNAAHDAMFSNLFNLAVVPFYWSDLEVEDGKPRFDKNSPHVYRRPNTDECLDFCDRYGIVPKGHPLMWHAFIPEWLAADDAMLKLRWEQRVREIAQRYGDRIRNWDVVNEAVYFDPKNPQLPPGHVEFAFDIAMKYLPQSCTLNYNDYACFDFPHGNYTGIYMLVKNLLLSGRKVDCLGLQYHLFGCKPEQMVEAWSKTKLNPSLLYDCMDQYAKLGIPFNISEITLTAHEALGDGRLEFQAQMAERLYKIWFSHPGTQSIIYWNLIDNTAFRNPKHPQWNENVYLGGLLDENLQPKPAYKTLEHLIRKEWHSKGKITCSSEKNNYFRGFYGDYDVTIKTDSGAIRKQIKLQKGRANEFTFEI